MAGMGEGRDGCGRCGCAGLEAVTQRPEQVSRGKFGLPGADQGPARDRGIVMPLVPARARQHGVVAQRII
jgi:hypothetical protein